MKYFIIKKQDNKLIIKVDLEDLEDNTDLILDIVDDNLKALEILNYESFKLNEINT